MPLEKLFKGINEASFQFIVQLGELALLTSATIKNIFRGKIKWRLTLEQMVKIGYESLPLALCSSGFIGMVFAIQISTEFIKFGAGKYVGGVMSIAMARELGPALVGIVIAARVAAAIAAELGTMKVSEQLDALQTLGSNPVRYLVIPRFLACLTMIPLLTIMADIVGFMGGYAVAAWVVKINPVDYMDTAKSLLTLWDVWGGLLKTVFFGMIIAIIACYRGINAKNGAKGVGEATTSSVVTSLITLFIVNYFLSLAFFK